MVKDDSQIEEKDAHGPAKSPSLSRRKEEDSFPVGLVDGLLPHVAPNYLSRLVVIAAWNSEFWEWQGVWSRCC